MYCLQNQRHAEITASTVLLKGYFDFMNQKQEAVDLLLRDLCPWACRCKAPAVTVGNIEELQLYCLLESRSGTDQLKHTLVVRIFKEDVDLQMMKPVSS